ncbi:DNA topoisomerase 3 [Oligella ureolytica]
MSKTLIIAEKPSVALDISRALGGFSRHGDYFESDDYVLSSSVGHLLTLINPDDVVRGKWSFNNLRLFGKRALNLSIEQREANSKFGFTAKTTLSLAQALYERHKVLTYPRTDSRFLPEDYVQNAKDTLALISESSSNANRGHQAHAAKIMKEQWVKTNKRIFNNAKGQRSLRHYPYLTNA